MKNVTFVQHAGDYKEAFDILRNGGVETYYSQKYSIGQVSDLLNFCSNVCFITGITKYKYDSLLDNGVRAVGMGFINGENNEELIRKLSSTSPTHIILTTPNVSVIQWAKKHKIRTLCIFADSFFRKSLKGRIKMLLFAKKLSSRNIEWIANHGLNASLSLKNIGINPKRIIPWDWPELHSPYDISPRTRRCEEMNLAYIGSVSIAKGVGDVLDALKILKDRKVNVKVNICGKDENHTMEDRARKIDITDMVSFSGVVSNSDVFKIMRAADAVLVPSRHTYPEGLPLTIYEALSARTPIIASDHPMFKGNLVDGYSSVVFKSSDPLSLANAIERLKGDNNLYSTLSYNSCIAWDNIQIPAKFGLLLRSWISEDSEWLAQHSLNSEIYKEKIRKLESLK